MDESQILIIGASGQLGLALKTRYSTARAVDSNELDITDAGQIARFDWSNTRVILNAAAFTDVDGAETAEGRAATWRVNAVGAANLSKAASTHDLTLVHISSDYVFDGTKKVHTEDEPFSPLGVYGQSKAAGDIAVTLASKHYILRTTWVIGEGQNFVRTMLGLAAKGVSPTVVSDQIGRLTFTSELVRAIDYLLTTNPQYGIYNVTNDGPVASWAEITRTIFELTNHPELTVTDTTTAEYFASKEGISPRPLNSEMDLTKLRGTGFVPADWQDNLKAYIQKELSQ